jgi:ATP-dependent phosphofructokinase / diphosphate-dependent phosphofructokinase
VRIGILTGGGDVPGLNACVKSVVTRVADEGHRVVGIRRGWGGLTSTNPDDERSIADNLIPLDTQYVRKIDRTGGTVLHTSRTNPARMRKGDIAPFIDGNFSGSGTHDVTRHVLRVLEETGIDVLIPIGGDDTLSYGLRLHEEGVPVIAIPKTMDNDVHGTDYCIGFSTAVSRGVQFIHNLRTAAGSHERIAVIELFGRYSGETSLITAYLAGVDRAVISEVPFDIDRLAGFLLEDRKSNPSGYAMLTVSEGAQIEGDMVLTGEADAYGHRKLGGVGMTIGELISEKTGQDILYQQIGYLMRSGAPDSMDLMVATNYAVTAADLAMEGSHGRMVALRGGTYTHVPISVISEGVKRVDVDELYDADAYRPKVRHVLGKPMFLY